MPDHTHTGPQGTLTSFVPALVLRRFGDTSGPPEQPEREQVEAAVLFADISGFTALTERLAARGPAGAEQLTTILNAYFGRLIEVIGEHGGEVVKFAGDAMLGLFLPRGAGGDGGAGCDGGDGIAAAALRAARCGLQAQKALLEVAARADVALTMRIGIGAGTVQVLYLGDASHRWECVPAGAPLAQMGVAGKNARTGEVVLSAEAWALTAEHCEGAPAGEGCMRLVAAPSAHAPTPATVKPQHADGAAVRFVSRFIRGRVAAGQAEWLSELRRVTVLFVKLGGIDHESADFLDRTQSAFAAVQACIDRFQGSIDKLAVDDKGMVVLAALGLPPLAHEDDPVRAVRAALAIGEALRELGVRPAIGIATGRVFCGVVGSPARREYTMMGDAVNLAARLMDHARGAALCDSATHDAASAAVHFRPLSPLRLKGKAQPVAVFEPVAGSAPLVDDTHVIGRATERLALSDAIDTLRAGRSSTVLLEGEPGIGKSRLVESLLTLARSRGVRCLAGAADSIGQASPYHAWRPIFASLLGLDGIDAGDRAARKAHVLAQMAGDPVLTRLAPLLRDVVDVPIADTELTAAMSGEVRAFNTQDLLVHLLRSAVAPTDGPAVPLAIVLEDAHWFDSASWGLLRQVHASVSPLLLTVATRPLLAAAPPEYLAIARAPETRRIALAALTLDETRDLLTQRLGRTPDEALTRRIHERSEGNPFFTEELAHAVLDAFEAGDSGALTGTFALRLPNTVQGTIVARIDRLDARQQLVIKVASVIGRRFTVGLLRDIHPVTQDRPQLGEKLLELERLDLTVPDAPEPDAAWLYRHETVREVAYDLLLYAQRERLHEAVARALEAQEESPALYARLAWHWARAKNTHKTLIYLEKSGEHALLEGAYKEAAGHFREALRLTGSADEVAPFAALRRAHWERLLGEAELGLGDLPGSRAALERAVALLGFPVPGSKPSLAGSLLLGAGRQVSARLLGRLEVTSDPGERQRLREAALAYLRLLETYFFLAGPTETLDAALRALNTAEAAGPSPELARAYALTGWIISMIPQPALCDTYLRLALDMVETDKGRPALQPVRFFTGFSRVAAGRWDEGRAALEEAVQLAERLGDKRRWIESVCGLSTLLHYEGQYATRVTMGADVLYTSARRQGDLQAEAWGLLDQIESLLPLGELDRAMELLAALVPFLDKDIGQSELIWGNGLLAVGLLRSGRPREAFAAAVRANAKSAEVAPVAVYCYEGYAGAAEVLVALRESPGDLSAEQQAALPAEASLACGALARYAGVFPIAAPRALVCRGALAVLSGKPLLGLSRLRKAKGHAKDLAMPYEEARALLELGRHLPRGGERDRALARAEQLFLSLGSSHELERARQASQRPA